MRLPILAALVLVLGCSVASSSTGSGLYGKVTRGPLTPVCSADTPCDGPAPGAFLLFARNGHTVRARTARDGRYRIALAPGLYAVRTVGPAIGRGLTPARVRVRTGRFARADFAIDTGIR